MVVISKFPAIPKKRCGYDGKKGKKPGVILTNPIAQLDWIIPAPSPEAVNMAAPISDMSDGGGFHNLR